MEINHAGGEGGVSGVRERKEGGNVVKKSYLEKVFIVQTICQDSLGVISPAPWRRGLRKLVQAIRKSVDYMQQHWQWWYTRRNVKIGVSPQFPNTPLTATQRAVLLRTHQSF